jgi:hypothetical protein
MRDPDAVMDARRSWRCGMILRAIAQGNGQAGPAKNRRPGPVPI